MDDSKLIEIVRGHPSIYNAKHRLYKDANVRDNILWKEIAESLKQPVEECRARWKNIRDTFMRHKRQSKLPTGSARSKKLRKWNLEENLAFLNEVEYERETLTNTATDFIDDVGDETQQNEGVEIDNNAPETDVTEGHQIEETDQQVIIETGRQPSYKRKRSLQNSTENIVELFKKNSQDRAKLLSTVLAKPTEEDPIDTFFKSMAMSVKKLSSTNQIRAKMKICEIVGQLELSEISSRPPTDSAADLHLTTVPASAVDNELQLVTNASGRYFI